jgi:alpha-galactosidase
MLDASARYHVQQLVQIEGEGAVMTTSPFFDTVGGAGLELDGAWIAHAGLPMPRATTQTCFIVQLRKVPA